MPENNHATLLWINTTLFSFTIFEGLGAVFGGRKAVKVLTFTSLFVSSVSQLEINKGL